MLVVGIDLVGQGIIACQFKRLGYHARLVATVAEAAEMIRKEAYAAVLVDCDAPTGGCRAVAELRRAIMADGRCAACVTLAWPASKCTREKCLLAGADERLDKPLKLEALAAVLQRPACGRT